MEQTIIQYPLFYPCTLSQWKSLESQANALLELPNVEKETYSKRFVDALGQIYFIINEEVKDLIDINNCLKPEQINWPKF